MQGLDIWWNKNGYSPVITDWQKVKNAGIDFIFPRDGTWTGTDPKFMEYVKAAQAVGIKVPGVFHFIYATSVDEVKQNAAAAIRNVQSAGLPKSTIIWCDLEDDTIAQAKKEGVTVTDEMIVEWTKAFCDYCLQAGYCTGIYTSQWYIGHIYGEDILKEYDIWLADLEGEPGYPCLYRQYDWYGQVAGITGNVDRDTWIGTYTAGTAKPKEKTEVTMGKKDAFIDALRTLGDGRYHYYDGGPNSIGCSEYIRKALIRAGIIRENEYFHAASGIPGPLEDKSRFQRVAWSPNALQEADIQWSNYHHTNAWDGARGVYEAAPESTHGPKAWNVCDNGKTGVGHWSNHGYYNCGTGRNDWDCIYRIIDPDDVKHDAQEEIDMDRGFIAATLAPYMPVIRSGKKGDMVMALQRIMAKYGWYTDAIDGSCGPNTVKGIKLLQQAIGVTPDGSFGPASWKALLD